MTLHFPLKQAVIAMSVSSTEFCCVFVEQTSFAYAIRFISKEKNKTKCSPTSQKGEGDMPQEIPRVYHRLKVSRLIPMNNKLLCSEELSTKKNCY